MKKWLTIGILIFEFSCTGKKNIPDVSSIKADLKLQRFEKDYFAIDSNRTEASLDSLNNRYQVFLKDFLFNILGVMPVPDSALKYTRVFTRDYRYIYEAAQQKYPNFDQYQKQIENGFRYVKYYFPEYKLPPAIITYIGPLDGTAIANTSGGLAIGLQSYLGKDFPAYQVQYIRDIYPAYKSRRFEGPYIVVDCMKSVIEEMYPTKSSGRPLIEQMIEAGKRLYVLDALLPEIADTLKTGYTQQQLKGCFDHESNIWSFFIENNLLYETESNLIGVYVNDGPNTPELGNASPGFVGQFTGWQIVKKWMSNNKKATLHDLMIKNPSQLFEESKYRPN